MLILPKSKGNRDVVKVSGVWSTKVRKFLPNPDKNGKKCMKVGYSVEKNYDVSE